MDKACGSTRHDPERAATHKEPPGKPAEAAPMHKDRDSASEKAIAQRRLHELASSGFRKRARSPEWDRPEASQRTGDPTPPRKERRRSSCSRSRTRSRDRQRPRSLSSTLLTNCLSWAHAAWEPCSHVGELRDTVVLDMLLCATPTIPDCCRSRGKEVEQARDSHRQVRRRTDRDSSHERGQRSDRGRRRYSRSPHSRQRRSERPSVQPSESPPRQRGKDVLALPGPAHAQTSSAMTVLDPGFAEQLQGIVAPLAALGPALQGIVSMLQAVPAALNSMKVEMSERDAQAKQELQHITQQNRQLQVQSCIRCVSCFVGTLYKCVAGVLLCRSIVV